MDSKVGWLIRDRLEELFEVNEWSLPGDVEPLEGLDLRPEEQPVVRLRKSIGLADRAGPNSRGKLDLRAAPHVLV